MRREGEMSANVGKVDVAGRWGWGSDDRPGSLLSDSLTWFSGSPPPGEGPKGRPTGQEGTFISVLNLKKSSVNEEV